MSYAPKRPHISKKTRALIFEREKGLCWICQQKIMAGEEWHADHQIARELGGSDDASNLFPAHVHCHRLKSKEDVKLIAKGNRIRKKISGLDPIRRKARPIQSRGFNKSITKGFDGKVRASRRALRPSQP